MIWHFLEVWALMLGAFAIGCPIGAVAYRLVARSPAADLQGDFADVVGDLVDGIKSRLGIGPVWRPEYRRLVERHADDMEDHGRLRVEEDGRQDRLPAGGAVPMIADQSDRSVVDGEDDVPVVDLSAAPVPDEESDIADWEDAATARPVGLSAPRNGVPDDLQRIRGVGRRIEQRLNGLGIFHFGQIAAWTPAEMRWVSQQLAFPERIAWDDWIGQATILATGGDTGFVKSADRRRAKRRQMALERTIAQQADDDGDIDLEGEEEITEIGDEVNEGDEGNEGRRGTTKAPTRRGKRASRLSRAPLPRARRPHRDRSAPHRAG